MRRRGYVLIGLFVALVLAACAPQQQAPAKPAPEPAKPAAAPVTKPAAEAPKPAAQPAKPAAEAPKPAAQPAKPAAEAPKPAAQPAKPAAQPVVELRAGSSSPKVHIVSRASDKFAELVAEKSKGEVLVRVFYGSLGAEQQLAQAVSAGSVDIGMVSNGNAGRFTTAWFVYDLPFLFKSYNNVFRSLDTPTGRKAIEQFEKDLGVKWLFAQSYGAGRDIETRTKQLKVPADIKGMKIRVVSTPVELATYQAWGANPTPVDYAQLYTALQQGTVDGASLTPAVSLSDKHYEIAKYNIRLDYQSVFETFFINAKKFASLSPQHQKALLDAGREAAAWNEKDGADYLNNAIKELNRLGMAVYQPTPPEYAQWAAVREKVWQEVAEQQKGKIDLNVAKQIFESQ